MEMALKGHLVQIIFHLTLGRACVCVGKRDRVLSSLERQVLRIERL